MIDKRLMILGSLGEFVRLVELAKAQGIYTVVCDAYEDGPAKKIADVSYNCDVRNIDEIVEICKHENVNGVITSFSDMMFEQMVKIADKAGLKCYVKPDKLSYYRNKIVAKDLLGRLGILTPKYKKIVKNFEDEELNGFQFPLIAKPINGYGSKGVLVINDVNQLRSRFDEITEFSDIKDVLIEEYYDGYELNATTWLINGKVHVIAIGDREKTIVDQTKIPVLSRVAYPSRFLDKVCDEVAEILQKFADATGQKEGALSMQFFWKEGTPIYVGEIAGRLFGYEHELLTYASGIDIIQLLLNYEYDKSALKDMFQGYSPYSVKHYAGLYHTGKEEVIKDQKSILDIAKWENVVESNIYYEEGEKIQLDGHKPYVVRYNIKGCSRNELDEITKKIYDSVKVYDDKGNNLLYQYYLPQY